jgi:hypothetical protein
MIKISYWARTIASWARSYSKNATFQREDIPMSLEKSRNK